MKEILLAALLIGSSLSAALPPIYQSIGEIKAILESKELPEQLKSVYPIVRIERREEGYEIETSRGDLVTVRVIYQPLQKPGPAQFTLQFNPK